MDPKIIDFAGNERFIILGVILLIWLAIRASQFIGPRSKSSIPLGAQREYGMAGGSVCPRCKRPIRLSLVAIKLGLGTKLTRCEFCGKWSLVHRLRLEELRAAEAAELVDAQPREPIREKSEEEKLKDMIDQSRFTDQG
ncbi:MAG: hypothetical protein IH586_05670 [Anaerolineaceae bacterium]|nr:hypothetical protein [Anaerolineaceae bacterium]